MAVEIRAADYAALRTALAAGTYQAGQMVFVEGRASAGDGGQGPFQVKYDAGGGFVDDGGVTITSADGKWAAERVDATAIDPRWFEGANLTAQIQAALNKGGEIVFLPGVYQHGPVVTAVANTKIRFLKGAVVVPSFDVDTAQKLYELKHDDCSIDGLYLDGVTGTATQNHYLVFVSGSKSRIAVRNCSLLNASMGDGNIGSSNLLATHAIYVENGSDIVIENNRVSAVSGAGVFAKSVSGLKIIGNTVHNSGWYPINIDHTVDRYIVEKNRISGDLVAGVYWGGAINVQSSSSGDACVDGDIVGNIISGVYSYGAVLRFQSVVGLSVRDNVISDCTVGTAAASTLLQYIAVDARVDGGGNNGPCRNVLIERNRITATGTSDQIGIYAKNSLTGSRNPHDGISIVANEIFSSDASNAFKSGIVAHGLATGFDDLSIINNRVIVDIASISGIAGGAIGIASSNATGKLRGVKVHGNYVENIGTPSTSVHLGMFVQPYIDDAELAGNTFVNFHYGVRALASIGANVNGITEQTFVSNNNESLLLYGEQNAFKLSGHWLWVDSTGDLRVSATEPTTDTSGTIVGTQS